MTSVHVGAEPCHNCRRRRLRCDRSLPQCQKCTKTGQECLGYQRLLRWDQGVASRGKMAGMTFEDMKQDRAKHRDLSAQLLPPASIQNRLFSRQQSGTSPLWSLTDPLLQDLSHSSRNYLSYFASQVCKDLVIYDLPKHNSFYDLIPLTTQYTVLLQIIIANSALHMSNASQKLLISDTTTSPVQYYPNSLGSTSLSSSTIRRPKSYGDALAAKQRALHLLKSAINNMSLADIDVTLAVVLLFIEFELIDSGKDNWRWHINGAWKIIDILDESNRSADTAMSSLRSCLISKCLVYDTLGSTLAGSAGLRPGESGSNGVLSLLPDAEANNCLSFPAVLLETIRAGADLSQTDQGSSTTESTTDYKDEQAFLLLQAAQSFDALAWATALQRHSPRSDLADRAHVASAHRAAVCIYLSRVVLSRCPATTETDCDFESLVSEVICHLSCIRPDNALFKATTWPTFIAGAETEDPGRRAWAVARLRQQWEVEPWGCICGALNTLELVWHRRNTLRRGGASTVDWIQDLRTLGVDRLIV